MLVYKIHPAIGVARVGDSPDAFFIGPEKPGDPGVEIGAGGAETPIANYKLAGKAKRQGVRFRVFEYDKNDTTGALTLKREITADDAQIEWKVVLVNRKAALQAAPASNGIDPDVAATGRNPGITGPARQGLVIQDPRDRTIAGKDQSPVLFDQCQFAVPDAHGHTLTTNVLLGELRTDKLGRLIVQGGHGVSASLPPGKPITSFANNDFWHDDVADGPVTAKVTFPGKPPRAVDAPAWVSVAPPDFAPGINGIITLYEVVFQAGIDARFVTADSQPSFQRDILPVILRASNLRFVNQFGLWSTVPTDAAALGLATAASDALRQSVFDMLITNISNDLTDAIIPDYIATYFDQYRTGKFVNVPVPPRSVPEDLDRAALEACVGLNFFPGIEASQTLRDPSIYSELGRFNQSSPLVFPGFLTEVMALPWQADFLKCQGQWWPSQRPDYVMTNPANIPGSKTTWAQGIATHEDLVAKFGTLAFVVPVTVGGQTVFVKQ
jgi:L-Lysine epsilon oxidase N-terminal/L-lysine epsilon oxidase C-terminal domain